MGHLVPVALLAALVAWVAKIADARGRFALGWAFASVLIGMVAFAAGEGLVTLAMASDASDGLTILAMLTPPLLLIGAMAAVALVMMRLPLKTSSRPTWPVYEVTGGAGGDAGRLSLAPGALRIDLPGGARIVPLTALRNVKADGECIRLTWDTDGNATEMVLLPGGKPDTPAGRKQQSRVVEQRVQKHIAAGSIAPLPPARVHPPQDR